MGNGKKTTIDVDGQIIDLKNRACAALLAWVVPGLGHYYQGRNAKAGIFFVAIMSTWILGFAMGGGHVVYASFAPGDNRWQYLLQSGVGAAAMPALVQSYRMNEATNDFGATDPSFEPWMGGFMSPPHRPVIERNPDEVTSWYATYGVGYEMGTWYTVIAGLLNILVIYDASGGPLSVPISGKKPPPDDPTRPSGAKKGREEDGSSADGEASPE